jgi:hypothetical protein
MAKVKQLIGDLEYSLLEGRFLDQLRSTSKFAEPEPAKPKRRKPVKRKITKKELVRDLPKINLKKLPRIRLNKEDKVLPLPMLYKQVRKVMDEQGYIYLGNFNMNNIYINKLFDGAYLPSAFALGVHGATEDDVLEENSLNNRGFIQRESVLNDLIRDNQVELTKSVVRYNWQKRSGERREARYLSRQKQKSSDCKRLFKIDRKSKFKKSELEKVNMNYLKDVIRCDGGAVIGDGRIDYLGNESSYLVTHPDINGGKPSMYSWKELVPMVNTYRDDFFNAYKNKNIR